RTTTAAIMIETSSDAIDVTKPVLTRRHAPRARDFRIAIDRFPYVDGASRMSSGQASTPGPTPSAREGMGARPYDGGVSFRVWAPHAEAVAVAGSFNGFSDDANPLAREEGGAWSADVAGAAV